MRIPVNVKRKAGIDLEPIKGNRIYTFAEIERLSGRPRCTLEYWRKRKRLVVLQHRPSCVTGLNYIRAEQDSRPKTI